MTVGTAPMGRGNGTRVGQQLALEAAKRGKAGVADDGRERFMRKRISGRRRAGRHGKSEEDATKACKQLRMQRESELKKHGEKSKDMLEATRIRRTVELTKSRIAITIVFYELMS